MYTKELRDIYDAIAKDSNELQHVRNRLQLLSGEVTRLKEQESILQRRLHFLARARITAEKINQGST